VLLNHNNSELGLNADLILNNIYTESEFHRKVGNAMRNSSELLNNKMSKELQTSSHGALDKLSQPSNMVSVMIQNENGYSQLDQLSKKNTRVKKYSMGIDKQDREQRIMSNLEPS
jgi:hypothetical protein